MARLTACGVKNIKGSQTPAETSAGTSASISCWLSVSEQQPNNGLAGSDVLPGVYIGHYCRVCHGPQQSVYVHCARGRPFYNPIIIVVVYEHQVHYKLCPSLCVCQQDSTAAWLVHS